MAETSATFKYLLKRHLEGLNTAREESILRMMWQLFEDEEIVDWISEIQDGLPVTSNNKLVDCHSMTVDIIKRSGGMTGYRGSRKSLHFTGMIIVSSIMIGLFGMIYIFHKETKSATSSRYAGGPEVPTDEFSCVLSMIDGQRFVIKDQKDSMLLRYGTIGVFMQPGLLQYKQLPYSASADSAESSFQQINTGAMEQYIVELPDGSRIRMNAQTGLKVYIGKLTSTTSVVELERGEIYVDRTNTANSNLLVKTPAVTVKSAFSRFNLRLVSSGTLLAVEDAEIFARNGTGLETKVEAPALQLFSAGKGRIMADTILSYNSRQIAQITAWKNRKRVYRDIELINFVVEMGRWYGIRFSSLQCLPRKQINATISYKADLKEFFAVLRKNGVLVHLTKEGYTFCEPAKNDSGRIAFGNDYSGIRRFGSGNILFPGGG